MTETETEEVTYTERQRHLEAAIIGTLKEWPRDDAPASYEVNLRGSWSFGVDADTYPHLFEGQTVVLETVQLSLITGLATYDFETGEFTWLFRKTDQDLKHEHEKMVEGFREKDRARLAANLEEWTAREAALPEPLRKRLERFRQKGGEEFDMSGWGYELVICELTVLYRDMFAADRSTMEATADAPVEDNEAITEYARREGTSGNQHDFAKAMARALVLDPEEAEPMIAGESVSALSPITGDADYSKAGKGEI